MSAERITENITRKILLNNGFKESDIEFQKSEKIHGIKNPFKSKQTDQLNRTGKPEYIIVLDDIKTIIIIECKDGFGNHTTLSIEKDDPHTFELNYSDKKVANYAEDGIIHYLKTIDDKVVTNYNLIGIAISSNNLSNDEVALYPSNKDKIESKLKVSLFSRMIGHVIIRHDNLTKIPLFEHIKSIIEPQKTIKDKANFNQIKDFTKQLHEYMYVVMELSNETKPIIVSTITLALKDSIFNSTYHKYTNSEEFLTLFSSRIEQFLKDNAIIKEKIEKIKSVYEVVLSIESVKKHLPHLTQIINNNLGWMLNSEEFEKVGYDIFGLFYDEFLSYTGGDKQNLGIVLTPHHICDLFAELANLNPEKSVVLDICTGTGGFLVSAMTNMLNKVDNYAISNNLNKDDLISRIKSNGLIGIDKKEFMFTIACTNMILRGDGKTNMFCDDSIEFDSKAIYSSSTDERILISLSEKLKELKPNVGMLNPPYAKSKKGNKKNKNKKEGYHEFSFIEKTLDHLEENGLCISIVPFRLVSSNDEVETKWKERILKKSKLKAVLSMPNDLFPGVGVVSVIIVLQKSSTGHSKDDKTLFMNCKDDGYKLLKKHRIEKYNGSWNDVKTKWLDIYNSNYDDDYQNPSLFILKNISKIKLSETEFFKPHNVEWCYEAYAEIPINITDSEFKLELMKHHIFTNLIKNGEFKNAFN